MLPTAYAIPAAHPPGFPRKGSPLTSNSSRTRSEWAFKRGFGYWVKNASSDCRQASHSDGAAGGISTSRGTAYRVSDGRQGTARASARIRALSRPTSLSGRRIPGQNLLTEP
jgi:hypothetical protein